MNLSNDTQVHIPEYEHFTREIAKDALEEQSPKR
jgi:hypothetical protein